MDVNVTHNNRKSQIEHRRTLVSALVLSRVPYREIAESIRRANPEIPCSVGTVSSDVAVIRQRWRERSEQDYGRWVAEEIGKLDGLEAGAMPRALRGDVEAIRAVLLVMGRRAKLLSLDREEPRRVEVSGLDGGPVEIVPGSVRERGLRLVERLEQRALEAAS